LASLFTDASGTLSGLALLAFLAGCIVGLVMLIFLLRFRKRLSLGTWGRLFLEIGLVLLFIFLVVALASSSSTRNIALGGALVVYGPVAAFVAYW
jgi:hypothetical protein